MKMTMAPVRDKADTHRRNRALLFFPSRFLLWRDREERLNLRQFERFASSQRLTRTKVKERSSADYADFQSNDCKELI